MTNAGFEIGEISDVFYSFVVFYTQLMEGR